MLRAIIFDCFGVLTTDAWLAMIDSLPEGVDVQAARRLNRAYNMGLIDQQEFSKGLEEITGLKSAEITRRLTNAAGKNTKLLDYIRGLRKRGYKIGLISNVATNWVRDEFLNSDEQKLFDQMILSYEVGMAKPDPRMFTLACKRLGVEPADTIIVDDIERYCTAARTEGLQAIVYHDFRQATAELEKFLAEPSSQS